MAASIAPCRSSGRITPLTGNPRIRVLARPLADWGARVPEHSWGSNHVRWLLPAFTLRLTTDVPVRYIREGLPFVLTHRMHLVLGPDEPLARSIDGYVEEALGRTLDYWREWVRYLSIPLEWQDAVIRSRDHAQALPVRGDRRHRRGDDHLASRKPPTVGPQLGLPLLLAARRGVRRARAEHGWAETRTHGGLSCATSATSYAMHDGGHVQPLYGLGFGAALLEEHEVESLAGYRGMGPVRLRQPGL
jgi:hypothetical protein